MIKIYLKTTDKYDKNIFEHTNACMLSNAVLLFTWI